MRGRKAKPRKLKLLTGNPGKRPIPEPTGAPTCGALAKPAFLKGRASTIWDEYAPQLALGPIDAPMFAVWCALYARVERGRLSSSGLAQMRVLWESFPKPEAGDQGEEDELDKFLRSK